MSVKPKQSNDRIQFKYIVSHAEGRVLNEPGAFGHLTLEICVQ